MVESGKLWVAGEVKDAWSRSGAIWALIVHASLTIGQARS
jgi:hypothetical protein